jgi:hypothetical protein
VKKLGHPFFIILFIFFTSSAATAASYGFHDTINNWRGGVWEPISEPIDPMPHPYQNPFMDEADNSHKFLILGFDWLNDTGFLHTALNIINTLGTATVWFDSPTFFGWAKPGKRASQVPESNTMILLGLGTMGLAVSGRKKFFKKN